jgi:hypothetical protein
MQIPLAFTDPVVIEEVSLPLWRELFDALGWPASLLGKSESLTYDVIVLSFQGDVLSDELLQAIETLHDLGTPDGRETINALLADRQIPSSTLPQGLGERELALRLFLSQRSDGALAEVFSRAQVQIQEGNHRRFNDFIGKKPKHIRDLSTKRQALERAILEHCQQEDLGNHVQLRVFDDDEGACRFQIMRSHHMRTPLAVMEGSASRAKIQYRPVHADLVRYEPALGRLRITARAASIVQFYRKVFGRVLFDDETFFDGPPVCSLSVLQEHGRTALASHGVFGVGRVWMTECIWERGDRERLNFYAADCFDSIERLKLPLSEGQLLQAKFKIEVIGKSTRPVTVTVRVPSRIEVSQVSHENLINEVLSAIGIRDTHARAPEHDLWTLYPWRQPISTWRDCFGADTDSLVKKGVLAKTQLAYIEPAAHPGAGRILQAEQISPIEFLGVSHTPEIPSQSLSTTDLDGLELTVPAFQSHLREVLSITGNATPWSADGWFLDLGVLSICEHEIRITYALRQPPRDAAANIKKLSASTTPVLLLPKGIKDSTGITEVLLDKALPDRQRVIRDIIAAFNLEEQVPALQIAPPKARLVVDIRLGKIWFDQIEITELKPGTHAFRFVAILAKNAPATINKHDLVAQLSPGRMDGDQTARSAKMAANKLIRAALETKGLSFEAPFKSENGYYRLTVPAYISDLSPQSECEKALDQMTG